MSMGSPVYNIPKWNIYLTIAFFLFNIIITLTTEYIRNMYTNISIILVLSIPFIGILYSATAATYLIAKKSKIKDCLFSLALILITLWSMYLLSYGGDKSLIVKSFVVIINIIGILFTLFYLWKK